jgi:hypothetical protein
LEGVLSVFFFYHFVSFYRHQRAFIPEAKTTVQREQEISSIKSPFAFSMNVRVVAC